MSGNSPGILQAFQAELEWSLAPQQLCTGDPITDGESLSLGPRNGVWEPCCRPLSLTPTHPQQDDGGSLSGGVWLAKSH